MNTIASVVIGSTIIICAAWIIASIVNILKQRANTRTRAEVYNRLIDKFGTAPELIDFLKSDAGLRFIEEQAIDESQPMSKILGSIRLGVSLGLIGLGMVVVSELWYRELNDLYVVIALGGTIALTAGVGFVISAAISYKLLKSWGLLPSIAKDARKAD